MLQIRVASRGRSCWPEAGGLGYFEVMSPPPVSPIWRALAVLAAASVLVACQLGREGRERDAEIVDMGEDERVFLGEVTLLNENSRFVLIKTPLNRDLNPGMPLQSFRDGQLTGELLFSPEQSHGFMTADIIEGTPAVGDVVYQRYTESFEQEMSPRMQRAMEEFQREQEMGFFERRKYERQKKKAAKERKRRRSGL